MSMLGKDIEANICSMITFADGLDPPVKNALQMSYLPFGKLFSFNNSALFAKNTKSDSPSLSPIFWDMSLQSFRIFFKHLETLPSTSLKLTSDVLKERHELEAIVKNLQPRLDVGLMKINSLNAQIKSFKENTSSIAANKETSHTLLIQEKLIDELKADLNKVVETVDEMIEAFYASKARLNEIALRPHPLTMKEHIDLLIENEKMDKNNGWVERIESLHFFRGRANIEENLSQFRMQATSLVTESNGTARNKKKD
ncbi:hypothetical protein DPMN_039423 [Dreissena polymorpha]|uniref:Uncharacterized protein n=1 Tax=Dreissena polymorpha TaxID=45954 RepID=A0A9D4MH55_DREPO|nr:hypothetical protein DPMN_039423 [Dreissena polymorpha]